MYNWIHRVWYGNAAFGWLLLPLSWLYGRAVALRSALYRRGTLVSKPAPAPVVVVGNVTAGGTGKTPVVVWLVEALRARGLSPGIVSRGYGGSKPGTSMRVDYDSDASIAGDEPVLLARRAGCPVAIDSNRPRAARMLVDDGADVIVTDDGLQHLRLKRDVEICVIDGARGLGNGRLLPSGPLREPIGRLDTVDAILINGPGYERDGAVRFKLVATEACAVNGAERRKLTEFANTTVHAVAAIGNPQRFFDMLRDFGIQVIQHPFKDHAALSRRDLDFRDDFPVLMTEKDAVKLPVTVPDGLWYVPVDVQMAETVETSLLDDIVSRINRCEPGP